LQAKAEAFAQFNEAAILDLLVRMLPQVVAAAADPMRNIDKLTVISTDGASSLTKTVASNVAQGFSLVPISPASTWPAGSPGSPALPAETVTRPRRSPHPKSPNRTVAAAGLTPAVAG
jgi:hypothetical protein